MPSQLFRLSLRFVLPLALVLGAFAYAVVPLMDNLTLRWFVRNLDIRCQLLASALQDPLQDYVPQKAKRKITQLFDRACRSLVEETQQDTCISRLRCIAVIISRSHVGHDWC
jgi:hypothetical protein